MTKRFEEVKAYGPVIKDGKGRTVVDFRFSDPTIDGERYASRFAACWNKLLPYSTDEIVLGDAMIVSKALIDKAIMTTQERDELLGALIEICEQVRQCNYTMARSNALTILQKYKK